VLGHEFVGSVLEVGDPGGAFEIGDRVVSGAGVSCGECSWCCAGRTNLCRSYYTIGFHADGGLAEAVRTPAAICHRVPDGCADDAAAMAQPLAVAMHALDRAGASPGDAVAVVGVGGIGSQLVAAAVAAGAQVFAVDVDPGRLGTAARLGAVEAIDARSEVVEEVLRELTGGDGVAVAIEASGSQPGLAAALKGTRSGGSVVAVGLPTSPPQLDLVDAVLREVNVITSVAHVCDADLPRALRLLAESDVADHVVDRVVPLTRVVPDGLARLADGSAAGKLLVDVTA
jgi:(R,R)-butanediol dehydrogenase / meso-butanediol dehydrogenase / diacetyl reductase